MVVTSEAQTRELAMAKARSPSEKRRVVGRYGQIYREGRAQTTSWLGVQDWNDDLVTISRRGSVHPVENQYTEFVQDA